MDVFIDGNFYLHRAENILAFQKMRRRDGFPTGVIYGVILMLSNEIPEVGRLRDERVDNVVLLFDGSQKSGRRLVSKDYKKRAEGDQHSISLEKSIPVLKKIALLLGWSVLQDDRYEADDLLVALAKKATKKKRNAVILTRDKDIAVTVNKRVNTYDAIGKILYTKKKVFEKFGVWPKEIPLLLALGGDKVDGIKNLKGVNWKNAAKIIRHYDGNIEALLADPSIKKITKNKIKKNLKLTEAVFTDVDLNQYFKKGPTPDLPKASALLRTYEIVALNRNLPRLALTKRLGLFD